MIKKEKHSQIIFYSILILLTAFTTYLVFHNLSAGAIYDWDEARHGVNAYEMIRNKNYIVNTFDNEPDYWNVKPPLSMWFITISYKLFGYNLLGLRFFSALCLPVILVISMMVLRKVLGDVGAITSGILFCATSLRFNHLFRTGDPDALFFLFSFLTCIFLYYAIAKNANYLIGVGICTALAFLTKSMHVVSLFGVIFLSLLILRKDSKVKGKDILLKLLLPMAIPVLIWVLLRLQHDGIKFFQDMFLLDVVNRVSTVVENNTGGIGYYFSVLTNLMGGWMFGGILLILISWLFIELMAKRHYSLNKSFFVIALLMFGVPMIIFSISKTKHGWYIFPALIGIYFVVSYGMQKIANHFLEKEISVKNIGIITLFLLPLIIGVFIIPYKNIDEMASSSSANNIFEILPTEHKFTKYYSVDANGKTKDIPQSWLLYGIYQGIEHETNPQDLSSKTANNEMVVILFYEEETEKKEFERKYQQLKEIGSVESYIAYEMIS